VRSPHTRPSNDDADLETVARSLESAAREAPPSPRTAVIRLALLENLDARPAHVRLLRPLAILGALLFVVALSVGVPAVGSHLGGLIDPPAPAPVRPDAENPEAVDGSDPPKPTRATDVQSAVPSSVPSTLPSVAGAPVPSRTAQPSAVPAVNPSPSGSPSPTPTPSLLPPGGEITVPTPPIPIPTPPMVPGR